jgi:hypothetical protein
MNQIHWNFNQFRQPLFYQNTSDRDLQSFYWAINLIVLIPVVPSAFELVDNEFQVRNLKLSC